METALVGVDFVPDTEPVLVVAGVIDGLDPGEIREKAKRAYEQIKESYLELARLLHEVRKKQLFRDWGFSSFKEYAQVELQIHFRKATSLDILWTHFGNDPVLLDKIKDIGWSKVYQLMRILNRENVDDWLSKARVISADDLKKEVDKYLKSLVPDEAQDALKMEDQVLGTVVEEQLHSITYHFLHHHYMSVCKALEKVQSENSGITPAEALSLICAEFLATTGDGTGAEFALGVIKQFETFQPLECLVVQRDTQHVVHGHKVFQRLIGSAFGITQA